MLSVIFNNQTNGQQNHGGCRMKTVLKSFLGYLRRLLLGAGLVAVPLVACSQDAGIPDSLSLDKATQLFIQNNPNLAQSRASAQRSASQAYSSTLWPNSSLDFEQEQEDAGASQTFLLNQPIVNPVEYGARKKSANAQKDASQSIYKEEASQLYFQLRQQYVEALSAKSRMGALQNVTETVRRAVNILDVRREEGAAGSYELKRLRTALADYENRLAQARIEHKTARHKLISFIRPGADTASVTGDTTLVLIDSLRYQPSNYRYKELLNTALQKRGLLISQRSREQAGKLHLRAEKAARFPDLSITGSLNRKPGLQQEYYPFLGLSVELPILNNNGPQIRAARAQLREFQAGEDIARRKIEVEVRSAFNQLQSYRQRMEQINRDILQKNKGLLEDALYLYSEGQLTLVELLDAASAALDRRMLRIELLTGYSLSRYQLEQAIGVLPPGLDSPSSRK